MKPFYEIATSASRATLPRLNRQPDALLRQPALRNTQEAVSRLRQFGLQPSFERAGGNMTVTEVRLNPSEIVDWEACSQTIAELLAPADEESLIAWIGCMGALVAKKDKEGDVTELELLAYARKLQEWPADVVREVLNRYPDENKWWPEWKTLRDRLYDAASERMALAEAYKRWLAAPDFMARREGIAPPLRTVARIDSVPMERATPAMLNPPPELTPEQRDSKMKAMKAAILKAESDG